MDDAPLVRGGERPGDLLGHAQPGPAVEAPRDRLVEPLPLHQLEDQQVGRLAFEVAVDPADVRVVEGVE